MSGSLLLPLMLNEAEMLGTDAAGRYNDKSEFSDEFNKRFRDIVADMYRLGYI